MSVFPNLILSVLASFTLLNSNVGHWGISSRRDFNRFISDFSAFREYEQWFYVDESSKLTILQY